MLRTFIGVVVVITIILISAFANLLSGHTVITVGSDRDHRSHLRPGPRVHHKYYRGRHDDTAPGTDNDADPVNIGIIDVSDLGDAPDSSPAPGADDPHAAADSPRASVSGPDAAADIPIMGDSGPVAGDSGPDAAANSPESPADSGIIDVTYDDSDLERNPASDAGTVDNSEPNINDPFADVITSDNTPAHNPDIPATTEIAGGDNEFAGAHDEIASVGDEFAGAHDEFAGAHDEFAGGSDPDTPAIGGTIVKPRLTTAQREFMDEFVDAPARGRARRKTFTEFCFPRTYEIQPQQILLGKYMRKRAGDPPRTLLLYHEIGSGKSCTIHRIAHTYRRAIIVMPAALIGGFMAEMRGPCTGNAFVRAAERRELEALAPGSHRRRALERELDARVPYEVLSFNKFAAVWAELDGDLLVVDEAHNANNRGSSYFAAVHGWVTAHPDASVVLSTATPVFDRVSELGSYAAMLRLGDDVAIRTPADVRRVFDGHVSYFGGPPAYTRPEVRIEVVPCRMSAHQAKWYGTDLAAERMDSGAIKTMHVDDNFYALTRQRSVVAYPNGLREVGALTPDLIRNSLATYSAALDAFVRRANVDVRARKHAFVFTPYKGAAGIDVITKVLDAHGWRDYAADGPGQRRYAVWSGDTTATMRDEIRAVYNHKNNDTCGMIAMVIGSPSMRAGVSLMRTRHMHVIGYEWNLPYMRQVFGRVDRFCSHKTLPQSERKVTVFIYASYTGAQTADVDNSIDLYMIELAAEKAAVAEPYLQQLRTIALDAAAYPS